MHGTVRVSSFVFKAFLYAVVLGILTQPSQLRGQSSVFATLRGRVLDPNGAVVPNSTVTLLRLGTNERQEIVSNEEGFSFNRVIPAEYELAAEKTGFRRAAIRLVLSVNDALTRDLELQVGEVSQAITVTAAASGVQTRAGGVSLALDERSISQLPVNGRDWSKLITLAPGGGLTPSAPVSGARGSNNTFVIDGIGNNDERSDGQVVGGGAATSGGPNIISSEAVQEFRVITSNADATFGRGSGAQINLITKSGTNDLHGSAYGFLRNDALDARDFFNYGPFFDSQGRSVTPPYRQQLFGATVGGPLQRDRNFVFGSYEGFRQKREATTNFVYPSADLIQLIPGDLGQLYRAFYLDRGLVTPGAGTGEFRALPVADRTAAVTAGFDSRLFDGNTANGEAGTLLQSTTVPDNIDQNAFLIRTDHVLTSKWRSSARFGYTRSSRTAIQFTNVSPIDIYNEPRQWISGIAEVVGTLTSNQILEVRGGWQHNEFSQVPTDGVGERFRALGIRDDVGVGVTTTGTTGMNSLGLLGTVATFLDHQTVPQLLALHTWQRGKLTLRSGFDLAGFSIDIHNGGGRPQYTFTGIAGANGLIGASPTQAQAVAASATAPIYGLNGGPTTALRRFTSHRQEYFVQADLRLSRTLTANLGVRYTYTGVYKESSNSVSNLYAVNSSGALVQDVHPFTFGRTANRLEPIGEAMYQPDRNNWQPRLGIAWDISGRGTTTARAAYGVYADRFYQLVFSAQGGLVSNPPFTLSRNAANVPFGLGADIPVVTSTGGMFFVDPGLRSPRVQRVSAGIERAVLNSLVVSADYVGTYGRNLMGVADLNGGGVTPASLRPDSRFSTMRGIDNLSRSNYHALQVVARQRYRAGLSFTLSYTLANAKDNSSAEIFAIFPGLVNLGASPAAGFQGGAPSDWVPRPIDADWGRTTATARHMLAFSHVLEIPFGRQRRWGSGLPVWADSILGGWGLSGILRIRSGEAVDLRLGSDSNDDGDTADRPALLSGSIDDLYGSGGDKTQFYVTRDRAAQILGPSPNPADPFSWVERNGILGPTIWFYDASLAKRIAITERVGVQVEANAFNLFNRTNFANPLANLSDARFGRSIATAPGTNPRQIQLGIKFQF